MMYSDICIDSDGDIIHVRNVYFKCVCMYVLFLQVFPVPGGIQFRAGDKLQEGV